jgi:hypothetical protein
VVLGPPALEEPAGVSATVRQGILARLGLAATVLVLGAAVGVRVAQGVGEDPAAELTETLRALGPPGGLWGRLAVEEESPVGAWTPLVGIDVSLYPATPSLISELERIRQSARGSAAEFESAVARVQAALAAHQGRIDRQTGLTPDEALLVAEPPLRAPSHPASPASPSAGTRPGAPRPEGASAKTKEREAPRVGGAAERPGSAAKPQSGAQAQSPSNQVWQQRRTDEGGVFVFDAVPAGDWLLVATHVAPYGNEKLRGEPKARQPGRGQRFLPRAAGPPQEAEMWVARVRVVAAQRVSVELTDRSRWLVGPVRGQP